MREGTLELALFGLIFFILQTWWISMTIRNLKKEGVFRKQTDPLAEQRRKLEKLLKK